MPRGTETVTLPGDPALQVGIRRSARLRNMSLRVSGLDGRITLSVPHGVGRQHALAFLHEKESWLRTALARAPRRQLVAPGESIPVDGTARRTITTTGRAVRLEGAQILVPGDAGCAGARVAAFLKTRARDRLVPMAEHHASRLDRKITGVSLRDTRSRWGSCTAQGRLMFSWRLAMAPLAVQDYVAAHEAAHLVHMDHSRAYWATVRRLMPDFTDHRDWLRQHGATLHAYVFDNG
jgi:predicted metal-dependent hydrolase